MLELQSLDLAPRHLFHGIRCAPGGGRLESLAIPLLQGTVRLPPGSGLQALLLASDLQGHERGMPPSQPPRLISHLIIEELLQLAADGRIPAADSIGVVLAGDLFAHDPERRKRGGTGDVQEIWRRFAENFRWVAGVAGNHDLFQGAARFPDEFAGEEKVHALDGDLVTVDGLTIGGISGVEGDPAKPWRYGAADFSRKWSNVLAGRPDAVVLHQGPGFPGVPGLGGDSRINELLQAAPHPPSLVVCGHRAWPHPCWHEGACTCLNALERVVLLTSPED